MTRLVRKVVELPPIPPGRNGFGDREFLLVDDGHGVALELCSLLESEGARVRVTSGAADLAAGAHLVDLTSLRQGSGPVLPGAYAFYREALLGQAAGLMVVTGSAGGFGIDWDGGPATDPTPAAGLRGLLGTIGKEFPEIPVRVVDVDTKEDPHKVASHLLDELSGTGDEIVVGYTNGRRTTIDLLEAPLIERPGLELGPESVVLLTGGARGITALASRALARNFGCHLELVGRTDPAGGAGYPEGQGAAEIRRALLGEGLNDPSEIETRTGRILAAQEVCRHLDALNKVAASVNYQAADLSNPAGVRAVVDRIYARHGRLDGVIHGAGILADRRIVDKKPDEFLRVFDAKVSAARALVDSLRPGLSFLICFGSVAGVYGNAGQADYAAANDALGTMTPVWARRLGARVTTIHWGPWASSSGGMVTPELERHYLRSGIEVIDPAGAVNALVDELRFGPEEPAEVLYTLSNAAWR